MAGDIFKPYDRNYDPNGRYQGKANYNAVLTDLVSQPDESFDDDLWPYYCYCYDSLHNKLSHVGSLSHDGETFTIHTVPVSDDGYLKHFVSCVTALGPDMLIGNQERCTSSAFRDRIQYYNPLDIDFTAYRIGFSFLVKNTDTGNQDWIYSIDDLKALDSTKNIVLQTAGRLFFKIESTGDWGGFVNNDNSSSIIYNCNDRVLYAKSSAGITGSNGIDVVPHWTMGCFKNGQVVAANGEMHDADTGFLIAGVVNTVDGEVRLPCSQQYNFTDDGLVIEVIEDWHDRNRITIATRLTIEQTLKEIAYLGLIVCHYSGATESVYAGYIEPDGLATGELIPYKDWDKTDSLNVKNQFMTDFPDIHIKPKPTPGPDEDEKSTYGGSPWLGWDKVSIDTGLVYREMTSDQMNDFRGVIENLKAYERAYNQYMQEATASGRIDKDTANEKWKEVFPTAADYTAYIYDKYGYGGDPVNSIISIIAFPFDIPTVTNLPIKDIGAFDLYIDIPWGETSTGQVEFVRANYYTADGPYGTVHSYPVVTDTSFKINLANKVITHPYDYADFRAYAPYTRLELYIPMHGTIDLDPAVVLGKRLSVNISVTVADGSSVATVLINDTVYQTINGQVGYSVPLSVDASSINNLALKTLSAQSQNQRLNAVGNVIHGLASTATSIATGNYGSAAGSAVDMLLSGQQNAINSSTIKYQIEHVTDGKIVIGQPVSLNAFLIHPKCQLIWHLPLMQGYNPEIYGKTIGYKCHKTTTLGALTGYTECANASLDNVSCTEAEKAMILEQLKNGIII